MRSAAWLIALQVTLLGPGAAVASGETRFPRPDGYVNDFAEVLAEGDEIYLENYLQTLERDTSAEVAVATVDSLDGMTIEEYANRLFAEWGIGKKQKDNGVLLLVAPRDRAVRIEVGYGLEGILPDGLAGEIIRAMILPEFRAGNVPRGIGRGLDRIARVVRRDPSAASSNVSHAVQDDRPSALVTVPFFGSFIVLAGFVTGLAIRTKTRGPLLWSGLFAGIPLFLAAAFISWLWIVVLVLCGLVVMAFGYRVGRSGYWRGMLRTGTPGSVPDGEPLVWVMGGTSGSSGSGSSSDSGGSSSSSDFGGGSSGGGGASGRW